MSDNIYKVVTAVSILIIALVMVLGSVNDAEAGPILLPGDHAGIACGPNFDFNTSDFKVMTMEDDMMEKKSPTFSVGCNVEAQVDRFKFYAGVNTAEDVDISKVKYEAGFVTALGERTRLTTGVAGHTKWYVYADGVRQELDTDFTVQTRLGIVF